MTNNESYLEYSRQIETMKANNQAAQNRANKLILIAAAVLFSFVGTMLLLNHFNVLNIS